MVRRDGVSVNPYSLEMWEAERRRRLEERKKREEVMKLQAIEFIRDHIINLGDLFRDEIYTRLAELARKYNMKFYDVEYQGSVYAFTIPDNCPSFRVHLRDLVPYAKPRNGQKTLDSFKEVDAH